MQERGRGQVRWWVEDPYADEEEDEHEHGAEDDVAGHAWEGEG